MGMGRIAALVIFVLKWIGVIKLKIRSLRMGLGISGSSTFRHGPVRPSSSAFSPTIADAFHLFWILGADLLILGWSGSHCTPHAIRIGQLWSAYSFLCLANLQTSNLRGWPPPFQLHPLSAHLIIPVAHHALAPPEA
jgi:hypothetical protein